MDASARSRRTLAGLLAPVALLAGALLTLVLVAGGLGGAPAAGAPAAASPEPRVPVYSLDYGNDHEVLDRRDRRRDVRGRGLGSRARAAVDLTRVRVLHALTTDPALVAVLDHRRATGRLPGRTYRVELTWGGPRQRARRAAVSYRTKPRSVDITGDAKRSCRRNPRSEVLVDDRRTAVLAGVATSCFGDARRYRVRATTLARGRVVDRTGWRTTRRLDLADLRTTTLADPVGDVAILGSFPSTPPPVPAPDLDVTAVRMTGGQRSVRVTMTLGKPSVAPGDPEQSYGVSIHSTEMFDDGRGSLRGSADRSGTGSPFPLNATVDDEGELTWPCAATGRAQGSTVVVTVDRSVCRLPTDEAPYRVSVYVSRSLDGTVTVGDGTVASEPVWLP
ncbi:hypothetical protein [Nocardioides pantholopis]|uniref:hypothetical protein n=1 Tax=Nocardioides pantholopis TaxID=2483798 RepID=UPI000FDBAA34|nr:hypothetical protein [Nocardioides pantholopis]